MASEATGILTATANRSFATLRMTIVQKAAVGEAFLTAIALRIPFDSAALLVILSVAKDLSSISGSMLAGSIVFLHSARGEVRSMIHVSFVFIPLSLNASDRDSVMHAKFR